MDKMKTFYITHRYYPHIGGVEYVVRSVAERLAKLGHGITVLTGEPSITEPKEEVVNGVRIIRWPVWSPREAYYFPWRMSKLDKLLKELAREMDVIHIHSVHSVLTVLAGLKVCNSSFSTKVVVTTHYHGAGHSALRRFLWIFWRYKVSALLNCVDVIHAVSKRDALLVSTHYPHSREKIIIIPNGVEEDVLNYDWRGQNSDYMVYAGRVEKYKRLEVAIDLAKEMGLKLMIVGRGTYREKLMRYADEVYRRSVEFLDPQPREKYLELLSKARYAINPSKYEAFSIFTAEALAIGVPAIVSKEIAENLEAEAKPFKRDLVFIMKSYIKTWNGIVKLYLNKLYR